MFVFGFYLGRRVNENSLLSIYKVHSIFVDHPLHRLRWPHDQGAKRVFILSILIRRGAQYRDAVYRVNDLLYMACLAENFVFMDQRDVTLAHISSDGIHPNYYGATILKMNILSVFRTFDRSLMNFKDDYEKALF